MPKPKVLKAIVGISRDTTAHWNAYPDFIPRLGEVIAYLDRFTITDTNTNTTTLVPDIKIGDGVHRLIDLPFAGDRGPEEITKSEIMNIFKSTNVTVNSGAGVTPNYTPTGTITKPNVDVAVNMSNGTAASCTFPQLTMEVSGETLNINMTNGSFTPNSPTEINSISAKLNSTPIFTGTPAEIAVNYEGVV